MKLIDNIAMSVGIGVICGALDIPFDIFTGVLLLTLGVINRLSK